VFPFQKYSQTFHECDLTYTYSLSASVIHTEQFQPLISSLENWVISHRSHFSADFAEVCALVEPPAGATCTASPEPTCLGRRLHTEESPLRPPPCSVISGGFRWAVGGCLCSLRSAYNQDGLNISIQTVVYRGPHFPSAAAVLILWFCSAHSVPLTWRDYSQLERHTIPKGTVTVCLSPGLCV